MAKIKRGTFMVYLKSMKWGATSGGGSAGWGEGEMYVVGLAIQELFRKVVASPLSSFAAADITWAPSQAAIQSHELLVYFTDSNRSLVAGNGGGLIQARTQATTG